MELNKSIWLVFIVIFYVLINGANDTIGGEGGFEVVPNHPTRVMQDAVVKTLVPDQ